MLYSRKTIEELQEKVTLRHAMECKNLNVSEMNYFDCPFCKGCIFYFSVEKMLFCPSCEFTGDLISFVMNRDLCSFSDAIEFLSAMANVKLEKVEPEKLKPKKSRSEKLEEIYQEIKKLEHPLNVHFFMTVLHQLKYNIGDIKESLKQFIHHPPDDERELLVAVKLYDIAKETN